VNAESRGVIGDRLGVVAGRHAMTPRDFSSALSETSLLNRAALLERVRHLQVFRISRTRRRGERGELGAGSIGCVRSTAPAMMPRAGLNVGEGDGELVHLRSHLPRFGPASPAVRPAQHEHHDHQREHHDVAEPDVEIGDQPASISRPGCAEEGAGHRASADHRGNQRLRPSVVPIEKLTLP